MSTTGRSASSAARVEVFNRQRYRAIDRRRTALLACGVLDRIKRSDASLAVEAAIEGMGVTLAMKPLVSAEIQAGRLAIPFDVTAPTRYSYYLVTPETQAENRSVAAFRDWLIAEAASERA